VSSAQASPAGAALAAATKVAPVIETAANSEANCFKERIP